MRLEHSLAPLVRVFVVALACGTVLPTHAQAPPAPPARGPETERLYLSGHGPDDGVEWEFLCTAGRRSRAWTTIKVPSCWEQQGFGTYNYGNGAGACCCGSTRGSLPSTSGKARGPAQPADRLVAASSSSSSRIRRASASVVNGLRMSGASTVAGAPWLSGATLPDM
jgi:hypothetical protein